MTSNRLLIVSNRLPVSACVTSDGPRVVASGGGLATGLRAWHERAGSLWIGWPGELPDGAEATQVERDLQEQRCVPVPLTHDQIDRYYHGFSNRVLWPLFHYLIDRVPVDAAAWDTYREVNEAFADVVAREYRPDDTIWVHDYHLMLLPSLLRSRIPRARIGFFLHIPFPSSEVFRTLPWRSEILSGLLGADLIGFHAFSYLRHFMTSLLHVEGVEADIDRVHTDDRVVETGVFPMGVDAYAFERLAMDPEVISRAAAIRHDAGGRQIVLGIDRLDYTKGIPRRLEAIAAMFEREPALRERVRYIQVAVPSRGDVQEYQFFRSQVEERVGRLNGAYGSLSSLPVHYIHQSVSSQDLVALYCAADVMLVTPLRDGMNLVAKEFAAARTDEDGVLVLSEFAGAAAELNGAITVNPYDIQAVAGAVSRALTSPVEERRARMRSLRRRVRAHDVHAWAASFMARLHDVGPSCRSAAVRLAPPLPAALAQARRNGQVRLLLDYDGTLVPLARSPELASPDEELLGLLEQLSAAPGLRLDIVSGRPRETLEGWLGHLSVGLWGEHGFWHRPAPGLDWTPAAATPVQEWMPRVKAILDQFAATTPGARVELKTASLAWHFREAPRDFGRRQAHELRMLLGDVLSNQPLEVLEGKKVLEVRLRGVSKALVAKHVQAEADAGTTIVAIGDDRTDEELFRALPSSAITIAVGRPSTAAVFHVDDPRAVRRLLTAMLRGGSDAGDKAQPLAVISA